MIDRNLYGFSGENAISPFYGGFDINTVSSSIDLNNVIQYYSDTSSSILIWWYGVSGVSEYVLQRSLNSDYNDSTEVYRGTGQSFYDTGLGQDTIYYYRWQCIGNITTNWQTFSKKTLFDSPVCFYEAAGLRLNTDNEYGNTTGQDLISRAVQIKSVAGSNGPTLSASINQGDIIYRTNYRSNTVLESFGYFASKAFRGNTQVYTASSPIVLQGDFSICARLAYTAANRVISGGSNLSYLAFNTGGIVRIYITNTQYTVNFGASLSSNTTRFVDFVWKRQGTTISISIDGGQSFMIATSSAKTDDFIIDTWGGGALTSNYSGNWASFSCWDRALGQSECSEVFQYLRGQNFQLSEFSGTSYSIGGVTWGSLPPNNEIQFNASIIATGNPRRSYKVLNVADKTFICSFQNGDNDYKDFIYVIDHSTNQLSSRTDLPATPQIESHLDGALFEFNGTIFHCEPNYWYDATTQQFNTPWIKVFDKSQSGVDLSHYTYPNFFNSIDNGVMDDMGYFQFAQVENTLYLIGANFIQGSAGFSGQRFHTCLFTNSALNSWQQNRIFDTEDGLRWAYPYTVYNQLHDEIIHIVNIFLDEANIFTHTFLLRSTDGYTWTNMEGNFSIDTSNNNYMGWDDLVNNFLVNHSDTINCRITNCHFDPSDETIFFISGDPDNLNNNGWVFGYGQRGNSAFTKKVISVDNIKFVGCGPHEGGYILRTGPTSFDAFMLLNPEEAAPFGNNKVIVVSTNDMGDTWTYKEQLSVDNNSPHWYIHGTANQFNESRNIVVDWSRYLDTNYNIQSSNAHIMFKTYIRP